MLQIIRTPIIFWCEVDDFKQEDGPPEQEVKVFMAAAEEQPRLPAVSLRILLSLLLPRKNRRNG